VLSPPPSPTLQSLFQLLLSTKDHPAGDQ